MTSKLKPIFLSDPYSGYYHREIPREDDEVRRVGNGFVAFGIL